MTIPDTAACLAAVNILQESDELVKKLWDNADYLKEKMQAAGFDIGHSQTPILPVMLGEAKLAQEFSRKLFAEGIFATAIGYPTVPQGKARIRVMNSAAHSKEQLDDVIKGFIEVGKQLNVVK
jgi:glycine C-acetyltransferase